MINAKELTKLYYSIGEVAEMFQVNTSLIRFWETEFKSIKPKKNKKGNRLYTVKDILEIEKIYLLVKEKGFTLEGAKKELYSRKSISEIPEAISPEELIKRLENIKMNLQKLRD